MYTGTGHFHSLATIYCTCMLWQDTLNLLYLAYMYTGCVASLYSVYCMWYDIYYGWCNCTKYRAWCLSPCPNHLLVQTVRLNQHQQSYFLNKTEPNVQVRSRSCAKKSTAPGMFDQVSCVHVGEYACCLEMHFNLCGITGIYSIRASVAILEQLYATVMCFFVGSQNGSPEAVHDPDGDVLRAGQRFNSTRHVIASGTYWQSRQKSPDHASGKAVLSTNEVV